MVALQILVLSVWVRVLVKQQKALSIGSVLFLLSGREPKGESSYEVALVKQQKSPEHRLGAFFCCQDENPRVRVATK